MHELTEGALEQIMRGVCVEKPVLQVLGYKKLPKTLNKEGVSIDRYRLLVSDGHRLNSFTMLATQLNHLITDNILNEFAVCKLLNYHLSTVNNTGREKHVILILDIEVLASGDQVGYKIGNPTNEVKSDAESTSASTSASASTSTVASIRQSINDGFKRDTSSHLANTHITPIAALSPYQNKWVIKARVTSKSPITTWSNSRGEGTFFSMDLIDESGEIRCTAWRDLCNKYYNMIEPGNVYYISRCTLSPANKRFNTLKNDYEMRMTGDTEIELCHEKNDNIPTLQFDFCPISQVENKEKNDVIDVLGVITNVNDVQHIVQRTTGRELVKRDINIVDDSSTMISVTLWGKQAEDFDGCNDAILAIKGARIGEFGGGKNLSLINSSVLKKDPDIPEAHTLRGWYSAGGHSENARFLSRAGGSGDSNAPLYTFEEATEARFGEKMNLPDTFTVVAIIQMIRIENSIYKACPVESCKKKVIDQSNNIFRCEKCNKEYQNFAYRLLANMSVADATGSRYITVFNEDAEKIFGMSAQKLGDMKESNNDAYIQKFADANFKKFTFTLRAKSEVFQDEMRIRHTCTSVAPINYKTYLAHLINKVSKLANIEKLESN